MPVICAIIMTVVLIIITAKKLAQSAVPGNISRARDAIAGCGLWPVGSFGG